ncbi:MAG: YbaN family protein [Clostridia bacterium]|nr:YbaN family protein [Clostridia bacterium]
MKLRKILLLPVAGIAFGLGTLGIFLPILPTVPLYLLTLAALTGSSERLKNKFVASKLYKKHLEPYKKAGGLTARSKLLLILWVTIQIIVAAFLVGARPILQIVLWTLYGGFMASMLFIVKTVDRKRVVAYKNEYIRTLNKQTSK